MITGWFIKVTCIRHTGTLQCSCEDLENKLAEVRSKFTPESITLKPIIH